MMNVKDGEKVIEVGCGNSVLLLQIKGKFPGCSVYGYDFSQVVIDYMKKQFPIINWRVGNCLIIKHESNKFNHVIAGELLEHMLHPQELLTEMYRICKRGGQLSISVPNLDAVKNKLPDKYHLWEFDKNDIMKLLTPYGKATAIITNDNGIEHINAWCSVNK